MHYGTHSIPVQVRRRRPDEGVSFDEALSQLRADRDVLRAAWRAAGTPEQRAAIAARGHELAAGLDAAVLLAAALDLDADEVAA